MRVEEGQELRTDSSDETPGTHFIVGSYSPAGCAGIRRYRLDVMTGEYSLLRESAAVPFPTYLARIGRTGVVHAVSETTGSDRAAPGTAQEQTGRAGTVWWVRLDDRGGAGQAEWRASGGDLPTHLAVHPRHRWLVVSNYGCAPGAGRVVVFPIEESGRLGEPTASVVHGGRGPVADRQSTAHVHSTVFTADGSALIAADLGADALVVYDFDADSGTLTRAGTHRTRPGWGPRYLHWSPDGGTLFVVGELAAELGAFAWAHQTRSLEPLSSIATSRTDRGVLPSDLHLSGDGRLMYVANRGAIDAIAVVACSDPTQMELLAESPSYGRWPRHFALAQSGRTMVVANQHSDEIAVLRIGADGVPGAPVAHIDHPAPSFVAFV